MLVRLSLYYVMQKETKGFQIMLTIPVLMKADSVCDSEFFNRIAEKRLFRESAQCAFTLIPQ